MEQLWAPWRMAFIETPVAKGCPFCDAPVGDDDRTHLILHRGKSCFIIMNLFPYNNGHLLIAPYRHTADLTELSTGESAELMRLTQESISLLRRTYGPDAFNLGMNLGKPAGAGIADHLHMHVVPRWNGDTNFMPVVAGTKVLPEALFPGYDKLRAALEESDLRAAEVGR